MMSSLSFYLWRSLFLASIVTLEGSGAFQFRCELIRKNYTCTIANYNPVTEGSFLFNHVPNRTDKIVFKNLLLPIVRSTPFSYIPPHVGMLSFSESSQVRVMIVPSNISITQITVTLPSMNRIRFERNCTLAQLLIMQSNLVTLPPSLPNLQALSFLKLSQSPLEAVNLASFCNISQLATVNLRNNLIASLTFQAAPNPGCSPALTKLALSGNRLRVVNMTVFASMRALRTIDFENNWIETVEGQFNNTNVRTVILTNNNLLTIDLCRWSTMPGVVSFTFAKNSLQQTPKCLGRLPRVKFLNFNHNKLTRIAIEAFAMLKELEFLYFTSNAIRTVTTNGRQVPPRLREVYFDHNPLQFVNLTSLSLGSLRVHT
ncbi:leucine-rich repeat-containing protein let-4-like [Anopheles stephensi]|uniref:leucine-rich repeat-containing protein let-4-like n=1 Tax=Anopheles stephensi TaxID=30069 RepID=UPI001658ABF7|nr:leucine-rich repeat-containing protein let-4-like [Anopheles stephensi]